MKKIIPFLNAIFFLALLALNFLANSLPLNGVTTGGISDTYVSLFTPIGFTFAIWGLIYTLLGIYIFYQLGFIGNEQDINFYNQKIGFLFITSCILNMAWLVSWHYNMLLVSLVIMFLLLINLIIIYLRIQSKSNYLRRKNYIVSLPFSIYLGWIMVASIANTSIYLLSINWNGFGYSHEFWTNIIILVALLIFTIFIKTRNDIYVMSVFVWASIGILYKHVYVFNSEYVTIIITVAFAIGSGITSMIFSKKQ